MTDQLGADGRVNIANRLRTMAQRFPNCRAIAEPQRRTARRRPLSDAELLKAATLPAAPVAYRELTFQQLDELSDRLASGMLQQGLQPGMKMVLFVPFSIEFVALTFALFKAGAVSVLIDPGMGRTNIFNCLKEVDPDGFVAIPFVQLVRWWKQREFPRARLNFSTGIWTPGVVGNLRQLEQAAPQPERFPATRRDDLAAVIFTSGSTGPPKGVAYEHGMFDAQVDMIQSHYGIEPGEVDLPGFPLFGLFNAAMGVTTIIPDMDPTRPAQVDPRKIVAAIAQLQVTQAFGSPAFWNRVGRYCVAQKIELPSLKRTLSAGGPVPVQVLQRMQRVLTRPGADLFTPYGATESLPVASIGGNEVLSRTAPLTRMGRGTCVGRPFAGVDIKIIEITEGPIAQFSEVRELEPGAIGEIVVKSPSVTREYFQRPTATALAKIPAGDSFWHRIGDVGYFDTDGYLWFCGRKAHIVETGGERLFSVCCEAIFDEHPRIYRSALVGIGTAPDQLPVLIAEPEPGEFPTDATGQTQLCEELLELGRAHPLTQRIDRVLLHPSLPVDTRHNVKINREALATWVGSG